MESRYVPFVTGVAVQRYLPAEDGLKVARDEGCTHWYIDASLASDMPGTWTVERVLSVNDSATESNLRPIIHGNFRVPLATEIPEVRSGALEYLRTEIELAAKLNATALVLHGGAHVEPRPTASDRRAALDRLFSLLNHVTTWAADAGVEIWLENLSHYPRYRPFSYVFTRHDDYALALSAAPGLQFILDVGHANVNQSIAIPVLRDFSPSIAALSLSNNDGSADAHLALDHGTLSVVELTAAIRQTNWSGIVAFETRDADVRTGLGLLSQQWDHATV